MLKNVSTRVKLMLFPVMFIIVIITSSITFKHYFGVSNTRNDAAVKTEIFLQQFLKTRIAVYQFMKNPNEESSKNVTNLLTTFSSEMEAFKSKLSKKANRDICDDILKHVGTYKIYFDLLSKAELNNNANTSEYKQDLANMISASDRLEESLEKINKSATELKEESIVTMEGVLMALAMFFTVIFIGFSIFIVKLIISSLDDFKVGLENFFNYLNRKAEKTTLLDDKRKDEFGKMAKMVNENIVRTKESVEEDRDVIQKVIEVLGELEKGDLYQRVKAKSSNPALEKLISLLNDMSSNLESNIDRILKILAQYSEYKYVNTVETKNLKEHLLRLAEGVNMLGESITGMLIESDKNGAILDNSSNVLLKNVDILNQNSNEAAAALEETAAALEQITGNIVNNTENVVKMSNYAKELSRSANEGQKLATKTTSAMDDINSKVNSINEAITVIDQIAFQTNILSLNAAVEAATAGEAGKGFAVVAQEVRNLASRSAEAAKEIKELVEDATVKANYGKEIADEMIVGYEGLNKNIKNTLDIISDVEMASKEQSTGIEQINDAITSLDQQTQQNAAIATQTHEVAMQTDEIAKTIVESVNEKEFNKNLKIEPKIKKDEVEKLADIA
ncbi:chemotaxis protein [Halarcobacter ebronensis]|uniref:Chemotaxis protein n=2 Tax=Halarcobacter ebronensis TaxID=1462615 RepID=A0A4Q1ARD5_9BACT|nr:chemotaxis protein [Halarcobacter ebronensis]